MSSMKDVAALAKVSVGTVSNVLNMPDRVSEPTRIRVLDAIEKLGWVRNESARQLRGGRSYSLGLVVMDIGNPFFADLARGVEDVAAESGYTVLLANSANDATREDKHLALLERQRVRGVILAPTGETFRTETLQRFGIPVVLVDRFGGAGKHCTASVDDVVGGQLAMDHLVRQGHRRLAVVGGTSDMRQVRERREGAGRAAVVEPSATVLNISTPTLDISAGRMAAEDIAALPAVERPSGVFAVNDLVAIGLLQGLLHNGLAVPEDVSIVGYDDIEFAAATSIPLSSVQQPAVLLGRRAGELLLAEIESNETGEAHQHKDLVFTPSLMVRESSAVHWPSMVG